ncbi:AraC family transcriptional regulator [Clostridium bowmanii]|uniref:AraC family transcriptional regulator n=1 Tax=Clostridium bowmanii TaxID=132925 RepID=UPI001C0B3E9F|nr:AraC family transcriptional regulator [Clostridium bowmanii]MBU3191047.1 AraC family transcriptional regulator [Clostridium bowmanii]MCA1075371.1 AraC family transcriptional regulator [Clostridium bowmanii]
MEIKKEYIKISDPGFPIRASLTINSMEDLSSSTHLHKEMELVYVTKGEMEFVINNDIIKVNSGNVLLVNGMISHSSTATNNKNVVEMYLLQFDPCLILGNALLSDYKYLVPFLNENTFDYKLLDIKDFHQYIVVTNLIVEIQAEIVKKEIAYEMYIKSCLYRILTILYRNNIINFSSLDILNKNKDMLSKLNKAFKLVENYYYEPITVEMACHELALNYHYFCRLFKAATGKTFIQYLNFVRIKNAEKLLLSSEKSIIQIMSETGFSSLNYFNKVFKSYRGTSPSAYRKEILNKNKMH